MMGTNDQNELNKFCVDCKYCISSIFGEGFEVCSRDIEIMPISKPNLVTGKHRVRDSNNYWYCIIMRTPDPRVCGPDAKYFEKKQPLNKFKIIWNFLKGNKYGIQ